MAKIEPEPRKITELETTIEAKESHNAGDQLKPRCPYCGSENVYGMSRVVGYFSIIENWNRSKKAELKRRQQGNYWFDNKS
ncbi:MAG: anaerobic ribonucleoside-triphosphate reductase [Candidatus Heimdallarchaeota archaeon]|nr:MAG: hypothetical protein DRO63_04085 [Candidatus Gerdarchaeota archaeon]RLI69464.1 MAG: hypothetical protein DRP02_10515 [Candidatus Gerdarchaeota archaeon]